MSSWLQEYNDLPPMFMLTEHHDASAIQTAIDHPLTDDATRTQLKGLLGVLPPSGDLAVRYRKATYGRYQPENYCATRMWRRVRWDSLPNTYTDVDAITCFPSILVHLAKLHGIAPAMYKDIEMYSADKSPYINALNITDQDLASFCSITQDTCTCTDLGKLVYNMFCYGAGKTAYASIGFLRALPKTGIAAQFFKQWNAVSTLITSLDCYADVIKFSKKQKQVKDQKWHKGCGLSMLLQSFETFTVRKLMQRFDSNDLRTYEFDGFMIELQPDIVKESLDSIAHELPIRFCIKERGTPLSEISLDLPLPKKPTASTAPQLYTSDDVAHYVLAHHQSDILCISEVIYIKARDSPLFRTSRICGEPYLQNLIASLPNVNEDKNKNQHSIEGFTKRTKALILESSNLSCSISSVVQSSIGNLFFSNGVFDLTSGVLRPFEPEDKTFVLIPGAYSSPDPAIKQKALDIFKSIFSSTQLPTYLRLVSRAVAGHLDKLWVLLLGDRNSGKGIIQELFLLLDSYVSMVNPPIETDETDISKIVGTYLNAGCDKSRLAFANEALTTRKGRSKLNGDLIKKLASGGDTMPARVLHSNAINFVNNSLHCYCFNQIPDITVSDALSNCWVFNMPYVFDDSKQSSKAYKKPDPDLKHWIKSTKGVRDALVSILADNYGPAIERPLENAPQGYVLKVSAFDLFNDLYELAEDGKVSKKEVQEDLADFGMSHVMLGKWLSKHFGITAKTQRIDGTPTACYVGLMKRPNLDVDCVLPDESKKQE